MGHIHYWDKHPSKDTKKRPFEAYVYNCQPIGSKLYIFESDTGATPVEALEKALEKAMAKNHD